MKTLDQQEIEMVSGGIVMAAIGAFIVITVATDRLGWTDVWPDSIA